MMRRKSLSQKIKEAQELLEANDEQMARVMRLTFDTFSRLKSGAIILNLKDSKMIEDRIKGLLDRCGLK
jgi:hypothetical protein